MTLNTVLLEQSFDLIAPTEAAKQAFGREFYTTLSRLRPEVEPLFVQTDMQEQARKLMATLSLVLHVLKKPEVLATTVRRLGRLQKAAGSAGSALSDGGRGTPRHVRLPVMGAVDNRDAFCLDRCV